MLCNRTAVRKARAFLEAKADTFLKIRLRRPPHEDEDHADESKQQSYAIQKCRRQ